MAKSSKVMICSISKARLAGAAMDARKSFLGRYSASQIGQMGQSLLL